ncbi:coenzyme PQQ biosynthesis protein PqqD (plasmid) [Geobacillus thermodenitrificans]|uniref:PqqD family protein n=1 Tax=Geobacillus thermodenitrificans TaxID=33940 RepID=UPI000A292D74|nr:PqqD family protein [Geobacillus thermodenitrificans]ARP44576.1 coenzyme PQQ biosynthesis protein PqqD [Geobacillus thermodenitrificans]
MSKIPEYSLDVIFRKFNGKALISKPGQRNAYMLNDVSWRIWELIDGKRTSEEIIDIIANEFNASREEVSSDYYKLQEELVKYELITLKGDQ